MTLHKQLLIFIFSLLVILFAGMWGEKFDSTREYLSIQLESHAQDTATSLGLSLTTFMNELDVPAMETMINVVFDRGYYQAIVIEDNDGKIVVSRSQEVKILNVPQWFVRLIPLVPPRAEALIMDGWNRAGTITVTSHPGYAYATLWGTTVSTALWFVLCAAFATIIGTLGLRLLLRPLAQVESQALKLCNREYQLQETIPKTIELQRVVKAMNMMTDKVQQSFVEQAAIADSLQQQNYRDSVTGLGNRRFLQGQVLAQVTERELPVNGAFLLVHCGQLQEVNRGQGYEKGDSLLKEIAAVIDKNCDQLGCSAARLGGGDFAILLPNLGFDMASEKLDKILVEIQQLSGAVDLPSGVTATGGGLVYGSNMTLKNLLSRADEALRSTMQGGKVSGVLSESESEGTVVVRGKTQWKELLEDVLERQTLELYYQKVVSSQNLSEPVHYEILTRIKDPAGTILPAGLFIAIAEQYQLIASLDKLVISKILSQQPEHFVPPRISLNLSLDALADSHFYTWLLATLGKIPVDGPKFNFEFSETRILQHLELVKKFITEVRELNHHVGIDHFGRGLNHFGYLQSLMPDYVKIDRAITSSISQEGDDNSFFIRSLCTVAHSLDILVMVEGIETEKQLAVLQSTSVDAVQGYHIHRPESYDRS